MSELVFFNEKASKVCNDVDELRGVWPPKVEDKNFLNEYLESRNFVSNKNDEIGNFEKEMAQYLDTKYFSFFESGASALHSALIACDVSYGDEVIVPAWTFAAPAFQVIRTGAIPIFADVKEDTYNIDEGQVEELLNKLQQTVESLESGKLSLEESVKKYQEGINLSLECKKRLDEAKQVIVKKVDENGESNF